MATLGVPSHLPLIDLETGTVSLAWLQFFIFLLTRTGGSEGNNADIFPFPASSGSAGQALVSQGPGHLAVWQTEPTKLSQFSNDTGFITSQALVGFSTPDSTQQQIDNSILSDLSNDIPIADTRSGSPGFNTKLSRGDHSHIRETDPTYNTVGAVTSVNTARVKIGLCSIISGVGVPTGIEVNGSLFLRADGVTGARLYVSDGSVWRAVAGV